MEGKQTVQVSDTGLRTRVLRYLRGHETSRVTVVLWFCFLACACVCEILGPNSSLVLMSTSNKQWNGESPEPLHSR